MGGLMITEPGFGSDALSMHTSFSEKDGFFHIRGKKHWAGLTGMADFWLLTARRRAESGNLMRDIDMFICEVNAPRQKIIVEEYFENLGLYQIPYGRNHIDVYIPDEQRLIPHTTGIKMLLDLLHRSRFQFSGMGLGFIRRILDEAINHTKSRLQANFTVCSAFCLKSGEIAGRSVVDSRPFQIFEGSNDILYHQIAESVLKLMKTVKEKSLYQFLKGFTARAADRIQEIVNFELVIRFPQRKLVEFGQLISRIVSMDLVLYLEEKGFRKDLIENTLIVLKQEISTLLNTFHFPNSTQVVVKYEENSSWFDLSDQKQF
ncbi:MAG: acyl-CoA dehydrogenase family protein [Bacteroidales bacterium]